MRRPERIDAPNVKTGVQAGLGAVLAHAEAPAGRAGVHAEVYAGVTPTEGVAPVRTYPCGKAQPPALARDLRAPTRCTMLDRLICVFIVIGGVTGLCAVTWPGSFPAGDPVAILVQYYTPNVYTAVVAWYYVAPAVRRQSWRKRVGTPAA